MSASKTPCAPRGTGLDARDAGRTAPGPPYARGAMCARGAATCFYEAYVDEAAFQAHMAAPHTKAWQEAALPSIERSTLRFPAHRSVAPAP